MQRNAADYGVAASSGGVERGAVFHTGRRTGRDQDRLCADRKEREMTDAVKREQVIEWARLAGMDDMMSESRIAMLADFAIFARAIAFMDGMSVPHDAPIAPRADAEKDAALTDEQIIEIFRDHYTEEPGDAEPDHILPFARAILAAKEKKS
jgi:hypothetical protein